jgi:hypothetical protein
VRAEERATLELAAARLRRLDWYPRAVRVRRVRIVVVPWLFRLPWFRNFDGYATHFVLLFRDASAATNEDLVTHELCHAWQMQHRPIRMPLSYLVRGYDNNRYELEARRAVEATRTALD